MACLNKPLPWQLFRQALRSWARWSDSALTQCNQLHRDPVAKQPHLRAMRNGSEPASDKKPSPEKPLRVPPLQHFLGYNDKWIERLPALKKLPKASKSGAFGMNNVLDFAARISFFRHWSYEKTF
ncbi:hypothetical protein ACYZT9_19945 [Pseudomonas sp. ZT5P21]